jgi:hypothetical protein
MWGSMHSTGYASKGRGVLTIAMGLISLALMLSSGATLVVAEDDAQKASTQKIQGEPDLGALVRDILQREVRAQADDKSLWCYRKSLDKDGKLQLFASCQTETVEINRLVAVDGQPLTEKQRTLEDERIKNLLDSPRQLKKQKQVQLDDAREATDLLKLIPDAFVFEQESRVAEHIRLKFFPNPKFSPSGSSEKVFYHMEGILILDTKQKRLVEISGRLMSEVKFGGGLLGHLDKGGTFLVKQQEISPQSWALTLMDVQMNGKALFFKTISVRTKEIDSDFRPVPGTVTIQQAAALTNDSGRNNMGRLQK